MVLSVAVPITCAEDTHRYGQQPSPRGDTRVPYFAVLRIINGFKGRFACRRATGALALRKGRPMTEFGAFEPRNHATTILGMPVHTPPPEVAISGVIEWAKMRKSAYVRVVNVHQTVLSHDDPTFRSVAAGADLAIPDSTVLRRAIAFKDGKKVAHYPRGDELMLRLCEEAAQEGVPVALIGGRDEQVLATIREKLLARYPMLDIAYAFSPPFRAPTQAERELLIAELQASKAALVFVGLGCPKQERWMAEHKPRLDATLIGVGAAFDFISGEVKPSPGWVHRAGFEWLNRLIAEPRRLAHRYFTTSPRFLWLFARELAKQSPSIRAGS